MRRKTAQVRLLLTVPHPLRWTRWRRFERCLRKFDSFRGCQIHSASYRSRATRPVSNAGRRKSGDNRSLLKEARKAGALIGLEPSPAEPADRRTKCARRVSVADANPNRDDTTVISKEGRKAGVLIGLENRDGLRAVWVRSPCLPPNTADVAETD